MTTPFIYGLLPDPGIGGHSQGPSIVAGPLGMVCLPSYFTEDDLLGLMSRLLPDSYLDQMRSGAGPGYEVLQAHAAMFSRASLGIGRTECGLFYSTAQGGTLAEVLVEFYRQSAGAGAVTVLAGTIVRTSNGGRQFRTIEDATFGALDLGPIAVTAQAVAYGYEWNVVGQVITAAGEVIPGEIDLVEFPLQTPPYGDPSILVRQIQDADGGHPAMLDALGADRGVPRQAGETSDQYSVRLRALPDVVTPDAIMRLLARYLGQRGVSYTATETWDLAYQTCWDAPAETFPGSTYDPNLFAYDDNETRPGLFGRWLGIEDMRGAFFVVVPDLPAFEDVGMAFDDIAIEIADHATTFGVRAHNAFDVPIDMAGITQGGYDGFDLPKQAFYAQLWDLLQEAKGAGIVADVEREGE